MKNNSNGLILGHPKGLFVLFFTEMWERFSYYGMRALLVLYMTQYLLLSPERVEGVLGLNAFRQVLESVFGPLSNQALSSQIYGLYTGLVYFTPFFGGLLADRWLGQRRAIYVGGVLMAIGHLLMAGENYFLIALLFLIVGNGFFKPNISTQVGALYPPGDERRDGAFTIFYMGINLGAILSALIAGTLGQKVGWHYGFTAAGIGMMIGLVTFYLGRQHLPPEPQKTAANQKQSQALEQQALSADDMKKVAALVVLCVLNIMFWGVYEQQGNTLQIWADENTDWNVLGFTVPSTWFQAFNPFFIIVFAPVLDRVWNWQRRRGWEPSTISKMGIGCLLAALGYVFMVFTLKMFGPGEKSSFFWVGMAVWLFTIGELYISPIGLSLVTKIAPVRIVSMMMGMWLMSSFFGNYLAGWIGGYYEKMGPENFFWLLAIMAASSGVLFFVMLRPLRKTVGH